MATLSQLAVSNLALKGAGTDYNYINRFFATKAEADAALADSSWTPVAGKLNACLTGDQGFFVYNAGTSSLDLADAATRAYIDTQIGNLVDSSPATLDTLNELAAAINDDPAYFTTAEAARVANTNLINAETSRATAAEAAVQADVDQNEADADAAIAAVQADVDQNETDADAAIAAENAAMLAAVAVVQADVDQNETDADAAIAAVQADVDQNESDADSAIAAVQADVDQNEADADAAVAAENAAMLAAVAVVQADVDQNETDADAAIAAVQTDVNQNEAAALAGRNAIQADVDANEAASIASLALKAPLASPALTGTPTSPTASQGAGTTQIATTAYVDTAVANLVDSAPGAINTLNELAAAINDDANFSTTITASIAAVQSDVNQNEVDADAAIAAVQADVDANEVTAAGLVTAENTAMLAAVAVVQADVDQNETDTDAADAALGVRIDSVESEIDTARTNIYTALGTAAESATAMGTFTGSILSDNTTVRALLQELETDGESRLSKLGGILTGDLTLKKSDGSAVALRLSRTDHADMNTEFKIQPSYVSINKECLNIMAGSAVVASFDERQRVAINTTDPDYTLDVGGDGHFSTDLTVGGTLTLGSVALTATGTELNYTDGVTSNIQTQLNAIQADVDQNESDADTAIALKAPLSSPALTGTPTAPTAGAGTNTTQVATTAFVGTAVANLIDGAPGALNTLNELAAALNDDTSAATNLTTLINANETHIDNLVTLSDVAKDANDRWFHSLVPPLLITRTSSRLFKLLRLRLLQSRLMLIGNETDADA